MYRAYDDTPPHIRRLQAKEERAVRLFEEPGAFGLSLSSIENLTDRTPEKWEREVDRMEAEETPWQREGEEF